MLGGLPYQRVRDAVLTHSTMAEGLTCSSTRSGTRRNAAHEPSPDDVPSG
jgi:hypothetical protein